MGALAADPALAMAYRLICWSVIPAATTSVVCAVWALDHALLSYRLIRTARSPR